ncbi:MAG TPA: hypothetical protein VIO61_01965 [Anaerolineaceae bacterium]
MSLSYVEYQLGAGFVDNWLTAGPQTIPVEGMGKSKKGDIRSEILKKYSGSKCEITKMPVERGPLTEGVFRVGSYEGSWSYTRCGSDHFLDYSLTMRAPHFLRAWAYTQVVSPVEQPVACILYTTVPTDVWLNGEHVSHWDQFSAKPARVEFTCNLRTGGNELLVRLEGAALPQCVMVFALRLEDGKGLSVQIPSLIPSIGRRNELEAVYAGLYLDRDVYTAEDAVFLHWGTGAQKAAYNDVHFRDSSGFIQGQAEDVGKPGDVLFLGFPASLMEGPCRAQVMPRAWEYYDSNIRISKELTAWMTGRNTFSSQPYASPAERREEALVYAASRSGDVFAEIARGALGEWEKLDKKALKQAFEAVKQRQAGSEMILLGLLGWLGRFGSKREFPQAIKKEIKACALDYRYWLDEPGFDGLDFMPEGSQIVFHTCELLAGQLFAEEYFTCSGSFGRKHLQKAEQRVMAWMQQVCATGFSTWDSDLTFAHSLSALSYLVDLARSEQVWDLASVLLDKLFFSMALNSCQGVFGSVRQDSSSGALKSGMLEATSGISRVMWGMGVFNPQISGAVSLALMRKYKLPPLIAEIAATLEGEVWSRQRQGRDERQVNQVTYRTPDGMLCSAQAYRPGEAGAGEQIWQATLGPTCNVFVNHPGCSSEKEERQPNYWRGNGVLPRVAQWKDALIALYHLPEDDRMGFTHAYFPARNFDEVTFQEGWIFGRKGDGYLALRASGKMALVKEGVTAYREIVVQGTACAWVCLLGRAAQDGDFGTFQAKVLQLPVKIDPLQVALSTLRGDTLYFGWEGDFLVNDESQPLTNFPHFDNKFTTTEFPCKQMEIRTENYVLRLEFGKLP